MLLVPIIVEHAEGVSLQALIWETRGVHLCGADGASRVAQRKFSKGMIQQGA